MARPKGWQKEPVRHGLAAKGVKTAERKTQRAKRAMRMTSFPIPVILNRTEFKAAENEARKRGLPVSMWVKSVVVSALKRED